MCYDVVFKLFSETFQKGPNVKKQFLYNYSKSKRDIKSIMQNHLCHFSLLTVHSLKLSSYLLLTADHKTPSNKETPSLFTKHCHIERGRILYSNRSVLCTAARAPVHTVVTDSSELYTRVPSGDLAPCVSSSWMVIQLSKIFLLRFFIIFL